MRSHSRTSLGALAILAGILAGTAGLADDLDAPPALNKPTGLTGRILVNVSPKPEGVLSGIVIVDPVALSWSALLPRGGNARLSPDGKSMAILQRNEDNAFEIQVVNTADLKAPPVAVFQGIGGPVGWSANGKEIIISEVPGDRGPADQTKFWTWRVSADGSGQTQFKTPETHQVQDSTPDGSWLLAQVLRPRRGSDGRNPMRANRPIVVIRPDGRDERTLASGEDGPAGESEGFDDAVVYQPRFSPDGRSVVYVRRDYRGKGETSLLVVSADGKDRRRLLSVSPWQKAFFSACWSPDGKWLAVAWNETDGTVRTATSGPVEGRLDIMAADGSSRRAIHLPAIASINVLDWR